MTLSGIVYTQISRALELYAEVGKIPIRIVAQTELEKKFPRRVAKFHLLSVILVTVTKKEFTILSSSVVERSAVNRLVASSNLAWGVKSCADGTLAKSRESPTIAVEGRVGDRADGQVRVSRPLIVNKEPQVLD